MRSIRSSIDNGPDTTTSARPDELSVSSPAHIPSKESQQPTETEKLDSPEDGSATRPISAATVATDILEPEQQKEEGEKAKKESEVPAAQKSLTSSTDPKPEPEESLEKDSSNEARSKVVPSVVSAVETKPASITKDRLPPQLSKVVMSYRTNEWAKHLSSADAPEIDELKLAEYPTENETKVEAVAPVNVEELQQTAENAAPRPASRAASQISNYGPPALTRSSSALSKTTPAGSSRPDTSSTYQPHDSGLLRSASQLSINSQNITPRGFRSSSGPLIPQQIVESPVEEDFPSHSPTVQGNGKFPSSNIPFGASNTLMGKRDNMLRSKTSYSANPSNLASTPEFPQFSSRAASDAGSVYNYPNTSAIIHDDDNMSLSARREIIRQSSLHQLDRPLQQTPVLYDSHQPKRQSSTPHPMAREQQLASWRASVQQDLHAQVVPKTTIERSRSALWHERQQEEQKRMFEERKKGERDSMFDERMRRGDMLEAHREALRRMQASASKNA